ncbi:MAG TPA: tetratricopeptide repeat protein [Ohtaekwangia sp.]|uniref:tetratricopeptide repeat protein n=1 Tax=Ohtaekwangia sp. TaxID=2066019 RepID=UPI002F920DFD
MNRLEQLRQFVEDDPDDPFNRYVLALEYIKSDTTQAAVLFDELMQKHPDYLPTYYHAGNLFESLGNRDKAIAIFQKGIELAQQQREFKALRELQSVLSELLYD